MNTVRKVAPMTEAQMSERLRAEVRTSRANAVLLADGSHWVWDARFSEWTCTKVAREAHETSLTSSAYAGMQS